MKVEKARKISIPTLSLYELPGTIRLQQFSQTFFSEQSQHPLVKIALVWFNKKIVLWN